MATFGMRLKEARLKAGLSQERLGSLAGIEGASASARMNQYERDKHQPAFAMVLEFARVLSVPAPFFYADDDVEAQVLLIVHALPPSKRQKAVEALRSACADLTQP